MRHRSLTASFVLLGTLVLTGPLQAQTPPDAPQTSADTQVDPEASDETSESPSPAATDSAENEPSSTTSGSIHQPAAVSSQIPLGDPEPAPAPREPTPPPNYDTAQEPSYEASPKPERPKKEVPSPFRQWSISLGLGLGWASSGSSNWTILGAGAGVFVVDGLKLGFDSTFWLGDKPFIATTTPSLTYIFHMVPVVHPYLGAFYRHYFVDSGYLDTDSLGGRGGVYFVIGRHLFIGGGVVYEHFLDDNLFTSRNDVYPEISFTFAF